MLILTIKGTWQRRNFHFTEAAKTIGEFKAKETDGRLMIFRADQGTTPFIRFGLNRVGLENLQRGQYVENYKTLF